MSEPDPVLTELDLEIGRLEAAQERLNAELRKARELREWWSARHARSAEPSSSLRGDTIEVARGNPSVRSLIFRVLEDSSQALTVPAIRDAALALGWKTTSANQGTMVRNTLRQLIEAGEVERDENGRYRLTGGTESQAS